MKIYNFLHYKKQQDSLDTVQHKYKYLDSSEDP